MTKYLIAGLIALAAFLGLYAWGQQGHKAAQEARQNAKVIATQLEGAKAALRASEEAAAKNRALSQKRLDVAEKQRKAAEARYKELHRALKDNPDWAASPVPDSVWDALGPRTPDGAQPASPGAAGRLPDPAAPAESDQR